MKNEVLQHLSKRNCISINPIIRLHGALFRVQILSRSSRMYVTCIYKRQLGETGGGVVDAVTLCSMSSYSTPGRRKPYPTVMMYSRRWGTM